MEEEKDVNDFVSTQQQASSDSDKKRNRIDSFAAVLANRTRANADEQEFKHSEPLPQTHNLTPRGGVGQEMNCSVCGEAVYPSSQTTVKDAKTCSLCNKLVHFICDNEAETFGTFTCSACRNNLLVGGDAMLSATPQRRNDLFEDEIKNDSKYDEVNEAGTSAASFSLDFAQSCVEQYSSVSTPPEPTTASNSVGGSQTPTPQPEGTGSDNDEYQPPGSIRRSESTRGGRGKGKKPANFSSDFSRQTMMKTRSGGKPPTTSYAAKFCATYPNAEEKFPDNKRIRGKGSKGKGNVRGRRNTMGNGSRGGKLISMYTAARMASRQESCQREPSETEEKRKISPEKNDYNRTVVVTSAEDNFMTEYPNLCLICGSIGKDLEGVMISCMTCAQSFHTYCVSMHDKLNMTLLRRGWRCLDCTICEGCGRGDDESNLLLCDECDISYHTYCLNPPLECIPSGSWRCKWCSACVRCNVQVKYGVDLQHSDGYCETCYSLRKCPKCHCFYEIGDLLLKCQHCSRWFHGACEGHSTEDQAENAAENAFRCSFCRPQTLNDAFNMPVVVDNVMVSKSMLEQIQGMFNMRRHSLFGGEQMCGGAISRSFSGDQEDNKIAGIDNIRDQFVANIFSMRGRGGSARGGPGRRVLKLGIGGFNVRNPKNRAISMTNMAADDEFQTPGAEEDAVGPNGKPRIRRPRKLRKPQLEDAYPANIQESFFGVPAVESRALAEQNVDEPVLTEYKKFCFNFEGIKATSELSEHTAEQLRNEQEMDMLGDIPLVDDIGLDIENLDFSDLIVGGDDEEGAAGDNVDSLDEGFNAGSTSSLIQNSTAEICSPSSASSIRTPSRMNDPTHYPSAIVALQKRPEPKLIEQQRLSAAQMAVERWEEDEPLGDKATKAAVLYANVQYPNLKEKFPQWADRVRQINKAWRELEASKRQEFVEWARKNRANCPTARRRGRRTNSMIVPTQQSLEESGRNIPSNLNQMAPTCTTERMAQPKVIKTECHQLPGKIVNEDQSDPLSRLLAQTQSASAVGGNNFCQLSQDTEFQGQTAKLKQELQVEEDKIELMKKAKRALAARQRQLFKQAQQPATPEEAERKGLEVREIEANLNAAKKAVQTQQRLVEKCRQRLKEHLGPQQQQQGSAQQQQFAQKPSTSQQQSTQSQQQSSIFPPFHPLSTPTSSALNAHGLIRFNSIERQQSQQQIYSNNDKEQLPIASGTTTPIQPPVKSTRGRKRKKPLQEQIRAPMMAGGSVVYANLQTELEKDIYDVVDGMIHCIEANNMEKSADAMFVKRILLSQQQQEQMGAETTKTKKKRQVQSKDRNQSDLNTEFEQVQERIKEALGSFPALLNSLELYQANDKNMLKYPNQTGLPDHPGSEAPLHDKGIGEFSLPFMPDVYDELETCRDDYIDPESLFPPTMEEICYAVDIDALESTFDDDGAEDQAMEIDAEVEIEMDELNLPALSIDNIANRSKLVKSTLLLGSPGAEVEVPIEPHWSRFDEKPRDLDQETEEVILEIDPSLMSREDLVQNLRQLLGVPSLTVMELETPPQTPVSPSKLSAVATTVVDSIYEQKPVLDEGANKQVTASMSSKIFCRKCGEVLPVDRRPIEEFPNRLGLLNEQESKVVFCSMPCYFKFLASCRVPLTVDLLEMAERCVDEETVEVLRQISVDNFAKRINAGLNPHSGFLEEGQMDLLSTIPSSSSNLIENAAHLPRDFHLRLTELTALMQSSGIGQEKKRASSEFKWRGHGWTHCDFELLQSFQRQQDEVKQKFTAIHMQTSKERAMLHADSRHCSFCGEVGDGNQELTGRLLNVDANEWVHVNCALWSAEVHVSEEGALMNVESALRRAQKVECTICGQLGASLRCYKLDCANKDLAFHLLCAKRSKGHFVKDKTYFCANHEIRPDALINRLDALRRLYVHRDENQLLSKIFNHFCPTEMVMRVGSLVFYKIGQLLPDQLKAFTTSDHIFPVGYKVMRIFWSLTNAVDRERMHYECTIIDRDGVPEFVVKVLDLGKEFRGPDPTTAWSRIQQIISALREKTSTDMLRFFPTQINGEALFGFMENSISKMLESLPGIDQLFTYTFKHGGTPLMDLPLAENPSGCARCEPCFRTLIKRKHRPIISNSPKKTEERNFSAEAVVARECRVRMTSSRFTGVSAKMDQDVLRAYKASGINERMLQAPHLRNNEAAQLNSLYKEMKKEWKENIYLARSKIQGLGLYAKKDLDMNQPIIEYIGEMIRNEVCEMRQRRYLEQNRGEYMFRIDQDWVVDATMAGGLARYINHSCDPNCGTKILTLNEEKKIVIYANRPIKAGEELTYDYQFEIEEVSKKIACLCGAPNCARWMN